MTPRVLVAGVGNVFCSDDGFGVAVAHLLAELSLPAGVELHDFGIRGIHLAYQLLDGYDLFVLIDVVERGGRPGDLYVIEPDLAAGEAIDPAGEATAMFDAHDLAPDAVLALVPRLGGSLARVVVVGCEPERVDEGMGLTPPVQDSVEQAAQLVRQVVTDRVSAPSTVPVDGQAEGAAHRTQA